MGGLAWGEIRRRWRAAAAVGLVLGLGFAAVLAAAAGARRTATAFPRMLAATRAPQVLVSSGTEDEAKRLAFYAHLADTPGVAAVGVGTAVQLVPVDVPRGRGTALDACNILSRDGTFGYQVFRPNVIEGRLPRLDRDDEILVGHSYAETFGVGVGDELQLVVPAQGPIPAGEATSADGRVARARIVGVGIFAVQVVAVSDIDRVPVVFASPAFLRRYAPTQESQCYDGAAVVLAPGADPRQVVAEIQQAADPAVIPFVQDLTANYAEVRRAIQPQVTALWLFAAAAAAGTALVTAQVLGRQLREATATAVPVWRALGATRTAVRVLVAAPCVVTAAVGCLVAVVGAVLASGQLPIGPARLAEPTPGRALHVAIHLGGALLVLAIPVLVGVAWSVLATRSRPPSQQLGRIARLRTATANPSLVLGLDLATGSRRGGGAVPVRSAAAGVSVAIAAVVATITFASALDSLVSEPGRYGRDWDMMIDGGFSPAPVATVIDELANHPAVAAIAGGRYGEVFIDGQPVPTVGLSDLVGKTFPSIIEGRTPSGDREIVMGKRTLAQLRRSIGDVVSVDTGTGPKDMAVVGVASFPRLNRGSFTTLGLGVGAMTRTAAFPPFDPELAGEAAPGTDRADFVGPDGASYEFLTVRLRPGATAEARGAVLRMARQIAERSLQQVKTAQRPIAIDNYAAVRSTPVLLAILLGAMAAATLADLVVVVVRRRRRDLALCAALGMSRPQLAAAVVVQAVLVAAVAMLVGVPLGLAGGRLAWSNFASDLGVLDSLRLPVPAIGLSAAVVLLLTVLVAAVPAVAATRPRPAPVLRAE